ncbi:MAG: DUF87 domain-containing protein [Leptolyngbyaceae bacterium]|nr:DUF87 domain-containing protein [Leptolyngbyaceae bacterium]
MFTTIEKSHTNQIDIYWGMTIPAIPDVIALEQFRTGCTFESALSQLCTLQQRWIRQLHGDSRFTLSWRLITNGDITKDLIFGLVGKTTGMDPDETKTAAQMFCEQVRDSFPSGYPLEPCSNNETLAQLRLPFRPNPQGQLGEFRRSVANLQTIATTNAPGITGKQINPWIPQAEDDFQALFRAFACQRTPTAIAINLRPTYLSIEEKRQIAQSADAFASIATKDISDQSGQFITRSEGKQFKLFEAAEASEAWQQFYRSLQTPFEANICLISEGVIPQSITSALQSAIKGDNDSNISAGSGELSLATTEAQKIAVRQGWTDLCIHRWRDQYDLGRLPWLFSPEEVHSVFRLPIATRQGVWGLPSAPGATDARRLDSRESRGNIHIGNLNLEQKQLTQHLLICGVPGSGKTNTSLYLLETLWRNHKIPWMVMEPAKTEYRGLGSVPALKDDLLVFTLGDETTAPFRFNPFSLPPKTNLDSHLGALLDLFSVSMSMWGPLPNVVEQLFQEAYIRKGFTIAGDNSQLQPPCFADVAQLVPEIVARLGYKKESTEEIIAAISVRLNKFCRGGLGAMLNTVDSIPFEQLMQRPVVLEMSQITNSDDRAFVMGLILNRCYQYWMSQRHEATGELKHLLLIEEAHNLLANVSETSDQEQANPKGKAVRNFANMLAEVRGFGQGIAIAEQNPGGLVPDVMVNTNIKLAHRVVEADNRETLGRSMLLTPQQEKSLASLKVGQFLYYIGGEPEPSLTTSPNFKDDPNIQFHPRMMTDEVVRDQSLSFQTHHQNLYAPLYGCPSDRHLADCIERGRNIIATLERQPKYQDLHRSLMLELLMAPFGAPVKDRIYPVFGQILLEQGTQHLTPEQIEATLQSAIAFLALKAVQEKGKVQGWLGYQVQQAHKLLVEAICAPLRQVNAQPNLEIQPTWIEWCRIPEGLLKAGFPHPQYQFCEAPGVFRYENRVLLEGDRTIFQKYVDNRDIPFSEALKRWVEKASPVYPLLSPELQHSLLTCLAIQLTFNKPESHLQAFLPV